MSRRRSEPASSPFFLRTRSTASSAAPSTSSPQPISTGSRGGTRSNRPPSSQRASTCCSDGSRSSTSVLPRSPGPSSPGRSRSSSRTRPGASHGCAASRPDAIGVRVPILSGPTAAIVARLGVVVATSANLPGGPDPCRLDEVPRAILAGVAAALDGGALPGIPSTVIDVTGPRPVVLREGAGDAGEALELIAAAHT